MPTTKNIQCKSCGFHIGFLLETTIQFCEMKSISKVEYEFDKSLAHIKCRCGVWNTFDKELKQSINYQKKAQEHLYRR